MTADLRPAIIRSKSEHARAGGGKGAVAPAHIHISTHDAVMNVYVKDGSRAARIRIVMRQKAALVQRKTVDITMHFIIAHNIAFIINVKH